MKINGKIIEGPTPEVVVIPKGSTEYIFKATPVLDYEEFEKLCPTPKPPMIVKRGGEQVMDYEDEKYDESISKWASRKSAWMTLKSLQATEGLEWDSIKMGDPDTWENYLDELKSNGFTDAEVRRILDIVYIANGLNQDKIEEATRRFLAGQAEM